MSILDEVSRVLEVSDFPVETCKSILESLSLDDSIDLLPEVVSYAKLTEVQKFFDSRNVIEITDSGMGIEVQKISASLVVVLHSSKDPNSKLLASKLLLKLCSLHGATAYGIYYIYVSLYLYMYMYYFN
jgi:hypothetical protein